MDVRERALQQWVTGRLLEQFDCTWVAKTESWLPVSGDASFRRYYRVAGGGASTWIAVDAPPEKENNPAFVNVANAFRDNGVAVPHVLAFDFDQGFMLLDDLGDTLLLPALNDENADHWMKQAFLQLRTIQSIPRDAVAALPDYDAKLLQQEMELFPHWYLTRCLQYEATSAESAMLADVFEKLASEALCQPQIMVHRDFHSRNLMVLGDNDLGVIDFQDAVWGPLTYDLVSLLKDCYISWGDQRVTDWVLQYKAQLDKAQLDKAQLDKAQQLDSASHCVDVSSETFLRWFDWMGLQRHIKVVGIFSRLYYRDAKAGYLADIPRTLTYILDVTQRYVELKDMHAFLRKRILPLYLKRNPEATQPLAQYL